MLTPIVRWAQNGPQIDITIDLSDVTSPIIELNETSLLFNGFGHGAQGEDVYSVELDFFNLIDHKGSTYILTDRNVSFKILKQVKAEEWPRLLKDAQKPAWLKIDFDKWIIEDSDDEKNVPPGEEEERINKITFEQRVKNEVDKAKDDLVIYGKVGWLTAYYLFQVICFTIIMGTLLSNFWSAGWVSYKYAYDHVAGIFLSAQIMALAEIVHPLVGINKMSLRAPLLNVGVRNFILFILIVPIKKLHDTPAVAALVFIWALHELIRFPHNLVMLHGFNLWILSWFRYSYWIIVYPAGFISAGIIVIQSIFIARENNRLVYPLPNNWNISFSLSSFLIIFFCCYVPGCLYLLKHMWILRRRKVGRKTRMKLE